MKPQDSRTTPVNPYMIIVGRESRGLSQKMLADALGVSQGRVSKVESGLLAVPDDLLDALARVLNYPSGFFLQAGAPKGVGIAEIFHRKRQDVPKKVLDKVYARMEIRYRHIENLLRATDIPVNVPHLDIDEFGTVADIARLVRATWHLPRGPIQDLTTILENAGVVVVPFDFETPKIDAISRWLPGLPPLIFVNETSPKDRLRFNLGHELGHLVMHTLPNPEIEDQANQFAAEFLLPERDIRNDLGDLTMAKLAVLKRYWNASMSALLKRADDLGTISAGRARALWAQMARAGYKLREPVDLDVPGEQPTLVRELVETHLRDLGYDHHDLHDLLCLGDEELWLYYLRDQDRTPLRVMRAI